MLSPRKNRKIHHFFFRPCKFSQYALCTSEVINHFESSDRAECPLACETTNFQQTSVEYIFRDQRPDSEFKRVCQNLRNFG